MEDKTFEQKKYYSNNLLYKYPDRIPLIIEKNENIILENYKYLLPKNINMSQFISIIRTKMNIASKQALFTFVKSSSTESYNSSKESYNSSTESYVLIPMNESIENIYNIHKNEDGFLYIKFGIENTFG
jgi:GABA(A) receptor-associated protein